jgi:hypothetical protein
MTPEAQRIAIAEACGWKFRKAGSGFELLEPDGQRNCADTDPLTNWQSFSYRLPNYLNDLNAMHEAEKVLGKDHWHEYWKYLETYDANPYCVCFATAAQRCEAFLKTLGLWND